MAKRDLITYLAVSFGLSWLVALPLWLGDGLKSPLLTPVALAMMFTPTVGVLAVWALHRTPFRQFARESGLTLGPARGRAIRLLAAAWLLVPAVVMASIGLSVALGLITPDLSDFSATLQAAGLPAPNDLSAALLAQIVVAVVVGPLFNAIPSLGEEWGWRGWLLPRLTAERGLTFGVLVSGVIWGAWHAPLTLLGYNYPNVGPWGAPMFVGATILIGALFGWLRLRSGSVWPAVVGHGSLNAVAPLVLVLGGSPNYALVGITGVIGWAVMAVIAALLFHLFPVRQRATTKAEEPSPGQTTTT